MIYVECNADEALVRALGVPKKEIKHSSDKGDVCKKLKKIRSSKGLVDEDPSGTQPSYIKDLRLLSHEDEIKILYDQRNQNHLILLCPKLEGWILKAAKEVEIDVRKYSLPDNENELHKVINRKLGKFVALIEELKQKRSRTLKTLEGLIKGK